MALRVTSLVIYSALVSASAVMIQAGLAGSRTERRCSDVAAATHKATRKSLAPWIKDDVDYYQYQVDGIRQLAGRKSFLLADDMGLGKSLQSLTVFAIDVYRGWAKTCLIICPVTLKGNWADEIE